MNNFLRAYLDCALWSSTDDDCNPLDARYSIDDFAPEAIELAKRDCELFESQNEWDYDHSRYLDDELAGHDFWLTRNHHGAGFWDRDLENGAQLTEASHKFGETDLYVGDDGKLYFSR